MCWPSSPHDLLLGICNKKNLALVQFGDQVILLTDSYVWVVVVGNIISGVNKANIALIEVAERETYVNIMYCVSSAA